MNRNAATSSSNASAERLYAAHDGLDDAPDSLLGMALRYVGLLVVTLASAVAISGYAPADMVAAVGL